MRPTTLLYLNEICLIQATLSRITPGSAAYYCVAVHFGGRISISSLVFITQLSLQMRASSSQPSMRSCVVPHCSGRTCVADEQQGGWIAPCCGGFSVYCRRQYARLFKTAHKNKRLETGCPPRKE